MFKFGTIIAYRVYITAGSLKRIWRLMSKVSVWYLRLVRRSPLSFVMEGVHLWHNDCILCVDYNGSFNSSIWLCTLNLNLNVRKPVFEGLPTTQAQTSRSIRAVWSASLLFAFWKVSYVNFLQETGLKLALSETPKTGFLASRPIFS